MSLRVLGEEKKRKKIIWAEREGKGRSFQVLARQFSKPFLLLVRTGVLD